MVQQTPEAGSVRGALNLEVANAWVQTRPRSRSAFQLGRSVTLLVIVLLGLQRVRAADPAAAAQQPPVQMQKFVVSDKHLLCFGVALELWEDKNTRQVLAMYVKAVQPDSMADLEGIKPGMRVWSVNAIPADNFAATFSEGSELGKIFLNRQNGDRVTLELNQPGKRGTRYVTLVQNSGMTVSISKEHPKAQVPPPR